MATSLDTADLMPTRHAQGSLRDKVSRADRRSKIRAFLLVAPLLGFLLVTFIYPIGLMLIRSVYSPEFGSVMPRTSESLHDWDGVDLPEETVWVALVSDLRQARSDQSLGRAAAQMNFEIPAARSLMLRSAQRADDFAAPYKEALITFNPRWADPAIWHTMQRLADPLTARFYLKALDHTIDNDGSIVSVPIDQRIYLSLFARTIFVAATVTVFGLVLGYPLAYYMSLLPARHANIMMIFVLLPFWTSLLVRTTSWIVILQREGIINSTLVALRILQDDSRLDLIFNTTGTIIAMTQILLPYMILPLYAVMRSISPSYMRAARSLGASQSLALRKVYIPQTLPAVGAGCLIVFIISIGYYITPALVGGESGVLISNMIAYHMQRSLNWGLASALGGLMFVGMVVLCWIFSKIVVMSTPRFS